VSLGVRGEKRLNTTGLDSQIKWILVGWKCSSDREIINTRKILCGNTLKKNGHLEDREEGGMIRLDWFLGGYVVKTGGDCNRLRIITGGGLWY